jgi:hypothetical protein
MSDRTSTHSPIVIVLAAALLAGACANPPRTIIVESLLGEMIDLDNLALAPEPFFKQAQASSYSRKSHEGGEAWFDNLDRGQYIPASPTPPVSISTARPLPGWPFRSPTSSAAWASRSGRISRISAERAATSISPSPTPIRSRSRSRKKTAPSTCIMRSAIGHIPSASAWRRSIRP